jgi:hypothetical protein
MFKIFEPFNNLVVGVSQKSDGPMELADVNLSLAKNRQKFFKKLGVDESKVISPIQSHSIVISKVVDNKNQPNADGNTTSIPGLFLTVTVADCFPIYFYNPKTNTIALAHSGWQGTVNNISAEMLKAIGSKSEDVLVGIGPGIQSCHFEIKKDILPNFANYPNAIIERENKIFIDLPKIIISQLEQQGVLNQNIENLNECSYCQTDKYFSFRRDKPEKVQAMLAYIGLNKI